MGQYAGEWNFHVGIPATCGSSGAHMVSERRVVSYSVYLLRLTPALAVTFAGGGAEQIWPGCVPA